MARLDDLCDSVVERLDPLAATVYAPPEPEEFDCPAIIVMPDEPFIGYENTFGGLLTTYRLVLHLFAGSVNTAEAMKNLADFLDPQGDLIQLLLAQNVGDTLFNLCEDNIEVMIADGYGLYRRNRARFITSRIRLVIRAP